MWWRMWTCDRCGEELEDQFDSCWKCAGKPDPIGLPLAAFIRASKRRILRGLVLAGVLIPVTWFFFGPIAGFHHMYGFGITFYLVLNGEDPQPGDTMWGQYAVKFFPERFVVSFVLWAASVLLVITLARYLARKRESGERCSP